MISERAIVSMVVAAALVAALIVAPAAAARTITANGTNVFVGEENLDFAGGVFAGTTQFVHYTGEVGKSSIDKTIVVTGGVVDELVKGIPTGHYYAIGSANPTQTYVNVQNPEATLDVMLSSSPKDSVNGKSISRDTSLNFKFYSNVDTSFLPASSRADKDRVSIYVEQAYPGGNRPDETEIEAYSRVVVAELQSWGFIGEAEVVDPTWIEVAYTWSWPRSTWKQRAIEKLEAHQIFSVGRYASWNFQGIADSIRDGFAAGIGIGKI